MRRTFLGDVRAGGVDVARMQAANANCVSGLRSLRGATWRVRRAMVATPGLVP